ncbi:hypothetical protein ACPPVO_59180 [Dactylosporangium sp. McL0621]|uniref:hypothetical protein n=1 Tax=Dactylosporangium sp. McL0621 TaxID=3415678 RepID=UPI003CF7E7A2
MTRIQFDDEQQAPTPEGWPSAGDVLAVVDPHAIAQRLLEHVSNDDVLMLLKRIGPEVSRVVLHVINLNLSGRVNAGMAGQLLVRLRHDKATASSHALRALLFPVVEVFRRLAIGADDWRVLVEEPDAKVAYAFDEQTFRGIQQVPASLRSVGCAVAIAYRSSAAAAALGFLAKQDPDLAVVYQALRERHPALPERYAVDIADVVDPARGGVDDGALAEPAPAAFDSPGLDAAAIDGAAFDGAAFDGAAFDGAAFDGAAELRRVEARWDLGRRAAERVGASLEAGRLPAGEDLATLAALGPEVRGAAGRFARRVGQEVASELDAIRAAASAVEWAQSHGWLRRLAALTGPAGSDEPLEQLRVMAARAETAPNDAADLRDLRSFYEFLVAAEGSPDDARDHADRLRLDEALPEPLRTLAFKELIRPGSLVLPARATEPGERGPELVEASPPAAESRHPAVAEAEPVPAAEGSADALDAELDELLGGNMDRLLAVSQPPAPVAAVPPRQSQPRADASPPVPRPEAEPAPAPVRGPVGTDAPHAGRDADPVTVVGLQAALIEDRRFGLAACIAEAAGQPSAVVAARQAMAYATSMRGSAGSLAAALTASAERLSRTRLADDRAGQLLGWGAAATAAAVAHVPQLAIVLDDLQPAIEDHAGLAALGRALSEATRSGIVVAQEPGATVAAALDLENHARRYAEQAAHLIDIARSRSIKYAPATGVYMAWMGERGLLGTLLRIVTRNDAACLADVREQILHAQGQEDRQIDNQYARQRGRRQSRIEAGARQKLRAQYREALRVASEWVATVERIRQLREQHADPSAERVDRIRRAVLASREDVRRDIAALRGEELARGRQEVVAALGAVGELIERIYDRCTGQAAPEPPGAELSAAFVVSGELAATSLFLDPNRLRPESGLTAALLDEIVAVAGLPRAELDQLYTHRANLGDHDITQRLIDEARAVDAQLAEELAVRWAADDAECGARIRPAIEGIKLKVEQMRMAGVLDERQWSFYALDVERLETHGRRDYRRIEDEIALLDNVLIETRAAVIDRTLADIDREAFDHQKVAAHQERLKAMARQGEIAGAEEYLEQIRAGRDLPSPDRSARHLSRFFPAVPELFATWPDLMGSLLEGLKTDTVDAALDALHQATELSVKGVDERRRRAGARSVESWQGLSARRLRAHGLDTQRALAEVLSQAGIDFKSATPDSVETKERRWWVLDDVSTAGRAANPALGSRMSPDGSTLRVLIVHSAQSVTRLIESLRDQSEEHTVLVVWLGAPLRAAERRSLMEATRGRPRPSVLLIDAAVLAYLVLQPEALRGPFADITVPFSAANPYQDKAGDAAEEMFFGRSRELREVQAMDGSSIVYGGRQLGKSALLRAAQREFVRRNRSSVAAYLSIFSIGSDGQAAKLWPELWHKLAEHGVLPDTPAQQDMARGVYDGIRAWLRRDSTRTLLVLLDEADAFLEADARQQFVEIDWFRRIMQDPGSAGRVKIVLAGLHRTARFSAVPNQPLSHFGQPILIGPLGPQQAYDMIIQPLETLGLRFANPQTAPAHIMAYTNNIPALLQILGQALVTQAFSRVVGEGEPPGVITDDDVTAVIHNAGLRGQLVQKYNLTLDLDHRYRVIALVLALAAYEEESGPSGLSVEEIAQRCRMYWPEGFRDSPSDQVVSLVDECVDLGVLARDGNRYRIRTPTVLRLLGDHESVLQKLFSAPEQLEVPSVSRRLHFRRDIGNDLHWRSPLTELQVDRIAKMSVPLIIVGTKAHGIHFVARALDALRGMLSVDEVRRVSKGGLDQVRHQVSMHPRSLVVVDATASAPQELADLYRELDPAARVVILASAAGAPAWIGIEHRMALSRLGRDGLRLWCEEENLPFHDTAGQRSLDLKTGGWPSLLARITEKSRSDGNLTAEQLLAWFDAWWAERGSAGLLADVGLEDRQNPVVGALVAALAAATAIGPVGIQDQVALIEMLGEQLPTDALVGFAGPEALFDALCVLGLFDIDGNGIQPDPVHLDAMRRAGAVDG